MIRGKFDQARCENCKGWHFAILLDKNMNPVEFKCTRCKALTPYKPKILAPLREMKAMMNKAYGKSVLHRHQRLIDAQEVKK